MILKTAVITVTVWLAAFATRAEGPWVSNFDEGLASQQVVLATGSSQVFVAYDGQTETYIYRKQMNSLNSNPWESVGGWISHLGGTAWIHKMAIFNNHLYVGGLFDWAGNGPVSSLAKLNLSTLEWSSAYSVQDGGIPGSVRTMQFIWSQADSAYWLYIGGRFDSVAGTAANNIARINLTTGQVFNMNGGLSPIDWPSQDEPVTALYVEPDPAVNGLRTWAGGTFLKPTHSGLPDAKNIAVYSDYWNLWWPIGDVLYTSSGIEADTVRVWDIVKASNGDIFFAGYFNTVNGQSVLDPWGEKFPLNTARWSASEAVLKTWTVMPEGQFSHAPNARALSFSSSYSPNNVYLTGTFAGIYALNSNNQIVTWHTAPGVIRYNTSTGTWAAVGGGVDMGYDIAIHYHGVYAKTGSSLARWILP